MQSFVSESRMLTLLRLTVDKREIKDFLKFFGQKLLLPAKTLSTMLLAPKVKEAVANLHQNIEKGGIR